MNQQLRRTSTSNLKTCNWLNSWKIISLMINRRDVIDYFIKVVTEPIEKRRAKEKKRRERRLKRLLRLFPSICHVIVVLLKRKKRWRRRKRRTRRRRRARAKKKQQENWINRLIELELDWAGNFPTLFVSFRIQRREASRFLATTDSNRITWLNCPVFAAPLSKYTTNPTMDLLHFTFFLLSSTGNEYMTLWTWSLHWLVVQSM